MKKKDCLVSIIIPAYNVQDYIQRGIESALNQTYDNIQVVIVDDGSTDNTWKVIEEYKKKSEKITAIKTTNKGVSAARNMALNYIRGDYFLFLDSDDWLEKNTVEFLLNMLKKEEHLIACDRYFAYFDPQKKIKKERQRDKKETEVMSLENALINTGTGKYNLQSSCYKLFSSKITKENNLKFKENIYHGEDGLFVFEYLQKVNGVIFSTEPLWNILERPGSATMSPYNSKWLTAIDAVEIMLTYNNNKRVNDELIKYLMLRAYIVIKTSLKSDSKDIDIIREKIKKYKHTYLKSQITKKDVIKLYIYMYSPLWVLKKICKK